MPADSWLHVLKPAFGPESQRAAPEGVQGPLIIKRAIELDQDLRAFPQQIPFCAFASGSGLDLSKVWWGCWA